MTNKWRWILLVWHDWRCAVWHAEGFLRSGVRHKYAESMRNFHSSRCEQLHRELFPPPPVDMDEILRDFRRRPITKL